MDSSVVTRQEALVNGSTKCRCHQLPGCAKVIIEIEHMRGTWLSHRKLDGENESMKLVG